MMLSDTDILKNIKAGNISIDPFIPAHLGSNSYDLTLAPTIGQYSKSEYPLDMKKNNSFFTTVIPKEGMLLSPGDFYLGSTNEYVCHGPYCPMLEGKSSVARLGISVHQTAGFGDIGFEGHWTLEITVAVPVVIYPNVPIAQVAFFLALSHPTTKYNSKMNAKYTGQKDAVPVPSMMWKNFKQ